MSGQFLVFSEALAWDLHFQLMQKAILECCTGMFSVWKILDGHLEVASDHHIVERFPRIKQISAGTYFEWARLFVVQQLCGGGISSFSDPGVGEWFKVSA